MDLSMDKRIKEIILRNTRIQPAEDQIDAETDLVNDLALDSILIVNLFADLEEEFNIQINVHEINTPILSKYQLFKEYLQEQTAISYKL
ncbi:hypothetical protein KZ483_15780 [Paenibacillus sp. sptzw28]|uniref:acyl carrier protein n=1 Tax=Paenibacillus sp. sptzw28 TaxID=715179 RepID=UPI001C6F0873|nr:phosphopantetheine-binding protein [Paenibacillus sp. sptzw28]QYR19388.1 hypothetical protein KZ483_15780 [Paenibacillus sp. sptzw28]